MKFEKAMANVVMFQNEDVVTTSGEVKPVEHNLSWTQTKGANGTWTCSGCDFSEPGKEKNKPVHP